MNLLTVIALFLIFLGGIGAILLVIGQAKTSLSDKSEIISNTKNENLQLKTDIGELKSERNLLKKDLENRDQKISDQTDQIISLNKELVKKSEYITNFLSGGDGYPIVTISSVGAYSKVDGSFQFEIINPTDWPLYDIEIFIYDFNFINSKTIKIENNKIFIQQSDYKASIIYPFTNPHMSPKLHIGSGVTFQDPNGLYYIQLKSRSSFVFEKLAFVIEDKNVYNGFIVYDKKGKILMEEYTKNASPAVIELIKDKFKKIPNPVSFNPLN